MAASCLARHPLARPPCAYRAPPTAPPPLLGHYPPPAKGASLETWLDLYRTMATAREIYRVELDLVRRGLAFFHVAGAGHEAAACLARHLTPDDWLHGVPIGRRVGIAHPTLSDGASVGRLAKPSEASDGLAGRPTEPLAEPSAQPNHAHPARLTIFASRPSCVLGGRVVTTEEIAAKIPGWTAAEAIKRTGVERRHWIAEGETAVSLATAAAAKLIDQMSWGESKNLPLPPGEGRGEGGMRQREDGLPSAFSDVRDERDGLGRPSSRDTSTPIVVCSTSDGTTQQGQFLEAIAEDVRWRLPVLFLIEDNHLAISTGTRGKTFWNVPPFRRSYTNDATPRPYSSHLASREGHLQQVPCYNVPPVRACLRSRRTTALPQLFGRTQSLPRTARCNSFHVEKEKLKSSAASLRVDLSNTFKETLE